MAFNSHYWSCSKFADWVRGTPKPIAETAGGWVDWKKQAKSSHPVRYWMAETALSFVQDALTWPARIGSNVRNYIYNRWIDRTNCLTASRKDIPPGTWCDLREKILYCLFDELQRYVEVNLAHLQLRWMDEFSPEYIRLSKDPAAAGLSYLDWAASLKYDKDMDIHTDDPRYGTPTPQALDAIEIGKLYHWWTSTYRNRVDSGKASGWTDAWKDSHEDCADAMEALDTRNQSDEVKEKLSKLSERKHAIEEQYLNEEQEMLIRLIKIRRSLWT